MITNTKLVKETGATFTPSKLADYISDRILAYYKADNQLIKVLDPACGEGALLSSIAKKLAVQAVKFELVGFDSNAQFLDTAAVNLAGQSAKHSVSLINKDFLQQINPVSTQSELFADPVLNDSINGTVDMIIANPPYVRTQVLGADYAQSIAKKFNLKGRVDLYYPFLMGMAYALKENGLLGVITSNRYLSTKSGVSVRKFLKAHFEILEIIDLGDTKLFDAAVLPAIFIGRKKKAKPNFSSRFVKIYEELNGYEGSLKPASNIYDIIESKENGYFATEDKKYKKTAGVIKFIDSKDATWALLSTKENDWINKVNKSAKNVIGDLFKVRVGIKSTADKVFIKDDWDSVEPVPESALLKELISQENINPWELSTAKKLKVLYPHATKDGKKYTIGLEKFPAAKQYLENHREKLSSRKYLIDAGRKWYELWVPQNPDFWQKPKLVFPDISTYPRFYFDKSKRIVNGNCYWIVAKKPQEIDHLLLIQGVANSLLMTKYHSLMFNNKLYSGRRRYFSQFVEKYPLPDIAAAASQKIIAIVKKLNKPKTKNKSVLIAELEKAVASAFKIAPVLNLD